MPQCSVCRKTVTAWKPHPHLAQRSEFMKLMDTIGSDMAVYQCPACGCTDRDRHLWLYLNAIGLPDSIRGARLLHLAPERHLEALFEACGPAEYIKGDLLPSRPNQIKVDAEQLQFDNGQFDIIVCNHVLEHVESPERALAEFFRCLKPRGLLIAQTPYSPLLKATFELKTFPGADFATLFYGQNDHVRLFADDIVSRFRAAGFQGELLAHVTLLPGVDAQEAGINAREPLFIFSKP
jgi:SAM-dependent methyltransferase